VDIYVHWSVFVIAALILLRAPRQPLATAVALAAYLSVLVIHESGHLIVARRLGYEALSMELYPICGIARFEAPHSRFDHAAIAWGGVLAQAAVGIPLTFWIVFFGETRIEIVNVLLGVLGGYSLFIAALNLLPFRPLDGAIAWSIIPAYFERRRMRRGRRPVLYKSSR